MMITINISNNSNHDNNNNNNAFNYLSVTTPPKLDVQPRKEWAYKEGEPIRLPCEASGTPPIEWVWKCIVYLFIIMHNNTFLATQKNKYFVAHQNIACVSVAKAVRIVSCRVLWWAVIPCATVLNVCWFCHFLHFILCSFRVQVYIKLATRQWELTVSYVFIIACFVKHLCWWGTNKDISQNLK